MSRHRKDSTGPSSALAAISVRVPTFSRWNSEAWFLQLEAQFTLTSDTTGANKFKHTLVGLNVESLVADALNEGSYTQLKAQLIRHLSISETARLNHLPDPW